MRILLPLLAFFLFPLCHFAQTPIWVDAWQLNNAGSVTPVDFERDNSGNFYMAGTFYNQVTFGSYKIQPNGNQDAYVVKANANGKVQWAIGLGGTSSDLLNDMAVDDSGNVYITGSFLSNLIVGKDTFKAAGFSYDGFLVKIDTAGKTVWTKLATGNNYQQGKAVITDDKGYVYWAGDYFGSSTVAGKSITQQGGSYDVWLCKISPSGNTIRVNAYGGNSVDQVVKLALAGKLIYMTGNFYSTNFKIGSTTLSTSGGYDVFLARLDTAFKPSWFIKGGSTSNDMVYDIHANNDGSVSVCGSFVNAFSMGGKSLSGSWYDAFIVRIAANAKTSVIAKIAGTTGFGQTVYINGINSLDDGSVMVSGYFSSDITIDKKKFTASGQNDIFVAKFNKKSAFEWLNQGGDSQTELTFGLEVDTSEYYYTGGYFATSTKIGKTKLSGSGSTLNFITKGTPPVTPPSYNGLRNRYIYVDSTFERSYAVKPKTDALYSLLKGPSGISFNAGDGYFSFTPDASQIGKHTVVLKAENIGGEAIDSFILQVIIPIVAENALPKYACHNQNLIFSQSNSNVGPVLINWEFGDGTTKLTNTALTKTYSDTGVYYVKMMVTNHYGVKDSIIDTIYIAPNPIANFSIATACKGDTLRLKNTTLLPSGKITKTTWNKDSTFITSNYNLLYFSKNDDTAMYKLIAETNYGCKDSISKQVIIKSAPNAGFSTFNACAGEDALFFDNSSSTDDTIKQYVWVFGDGKTKTVDYPSMTYTYTAGGDFNVSLTVVTGNGCSSTYKTKLTVYKKPKSSFEANDMCFGKILELKDNSTTPVGIISQRRWTTGDGKSYVKQDVSHAYKAPGKYLITLITANSIGCTDTLKKEIIVAAKAHAKISAGKACEGSYLSLIDSSLNGANDEWLANKWMKDGQQFGSGNRVQTFVEDSDIKITLLVATKAGCTDSVSIDFTPLKPEKSQFSLPDGCAGDTFLIDESYDVSNLNTIVWVGLGVRVIDNDSLWKAVYYESDKHQLFARTIAKNGCQDSSVFDDFEVFELPKGGFSHVLDSITKEVRFKSLDPNADTYEWDFGKGNEPQITNIDSTKEIYTINGVYTVSLRTKSDKGCVVQTDSVLSIYLSNSIENIDLNVISVFPNPSTSLIRISTENNINVNSWLITNLNGETLKSGKGNEVSIEELAKGIYILNIETNKGLILKQFHKF